MIIDFHTHIFPDEIADRTVAHLERVGCIKAYSDGSLSGLKQEMRESGVTHSVALPVVTRPGQFERVNLFAEEVTGQGTDQDGKTVISFGGLHPETADYKKDLRTIKALGLKGIKLHPYYQGTYMDDIKYKRIIDFASELDLIITVHCGRDIGYPKDIFCTPENTARMLKDVQPKNLILAHMGGLDMAEDSERMLIGGDYYMDLAYCLRLMQPVQALRMARNHGIGKILFATDSPWSGQSVDVEYIRTLGFTQEELDCILYKNGARLLGIPSSEKNKITII